MIVPCLASDDGLIAYLPQALYDALGAPRVRNVNIPGRPALRRHFPRIPEDGLALNDPDDGFYRVVMGSPGADDELELLDLYLGMEEVRPRPAWNGMEMP